MFRKLNCEVCKIELGTIYVESVWEKKDDESFKLLHFLCSSCSTKKEASSLYDSKHSPEQVTLKPDAKVIIETTKKEEGKPI